MSRFEVSSPGAYGAQQLDHWKYAQVLEVDS